MLCYLLCIGFKDKGLLNYLIKHPLLDPYVFNTIYSFSGSDEDIFRNKLKSLNENSIKIAMQIFKNRNGTFPEVCIDDNYIKITWFVYEGIFKLKTKVNYSFSIISSYSYDVFKNETTIENFCKNIKIRRYYYDRDRNLSLYIPKIIRNLEIDLNS